MIALNFLDKNLTAFSFKDVAGTAKSIFNKQDLQKQSF